jgi:hypothetical protein
MALQLWLGLLSERRFGDHFTGCHPIAGYGTHMMSYFPSWLEGWIAQASDRERLNYLLKKRERMK